MKLCFQHDVTLVIVPSSVTSLGMKGYLTRELIRLGFDVAKSTDDMSGEEHCQQPVALAVNAVVPDEGVLQDVASVVTDEQSTA